jgi:hypothetical protein
VSFNPNQRFTVEYSDTLLERATSDGGLLLVRELDERLGLSSLMPEHIIIDDRCGKNT